MQSFHVVESSSIFQIPFRNGSDYKEMESITLPIMFMNASSSQKKYL